MLLDDDFGAIVQSVRLGRRIYDNIRKAMAFIFAVHVPIAGLALLPLFVGLPLLFGPIHIALLEMVIDPVCALVFEAERDEDDVMQRRPRDPAEPLFSAPMIVWSMFQGGFAFAMLATVFLVETWSGMPEAELRELIGSHGCKLASLTYRLASEGKYFEYRGVLSTLEESNVRELSETLRVRPAVVEFRLASTGT